MAYEYGDLKWSEMTDEQRESVGSKSDHKAAKSEYEQSQSTPPPDDLNPLNSKYSEMSDTYKENTSKANHKAAKEKAEQYENTKYSEIEDEEYKALVNRSTHKDNKQSSRESEQDSDPLNTNYSDMSDTYKANTTKEDHKQDRKDAGFYTNDRLESYKVDNLDDLDITATGRGRKEGENRLSVTELERMTAAGHSKEDIANRAMTGEWSDAKRGSAAQELLDSWIADLTNPTPTPDPTPTPTPTTPTPTTPTPTPTPSTPSPTPSVPSNPNVPPGGGNPYNPGNPVVDNSPVNNEANVDQNQELSNENNSTNIIDGNGNVIDNRQWNFGGNQTTNIWQQGHNIGGGYGNFNYVDTTATKMALGRSTDYDSPSDTAEFVARHSAINDMVQNHTPNYAQSSIDNARSNKVVDTVAVDTRISQRPLYMDAQSKMMGLNLFGDTFKFQPPTWESGLGTGDPADKPDLEGIADDIKDDIDDI